MPKPLSSIPDAKGVPKAAYVLLEAGAIMRYNRAAVYTNDVLEGYGEAEGQ